MTLEVTYTPFELKVLAFCQTARSYRELFDQFVLNEGQIRAASFKLQSVGALRIVDVFRRAQRLQATDMGLLVLERAATT